LYYQISRSLRGTVLATPSLIVLEDKGTEAVNNGGEGVNEQSETW
jgi:hypothetical protein